MNYKYFLLFSIFYFLVDTSTILAQETIDTILLPDTKSGSYSYTFGIEYSPSGSETTDIVTPNLSIERTRFLQNFIFNASGSYSFSRHLSISAFLRPSLSYSQEKQKINDTDNIENETESDISTGFNLNYRVAPNSDFNPRLSVGYTYPSTLRFQSSANLISDPIVLSGTVGYANSLNDATSELQTSLGFTFLANRDISLSANVNYNIPLQEVEAPTTSVELRTRFWLDSDQRQSISVKNISETTGNQNIPVLGIAYSYQSERSLYEIDESEQSNNEDNESTNNPVNEKPNSKQNKQTRNQDIQKQSVKLAQNQKSELLQNKDSLSKGINFEKFETSQGNSESINNTGSKNSSKHDRMVSFANLRILSEAVKKGWWLSTTQLAKLLSVSKNTIISQDKSFQAYGFEFTQVKGWRQQKQWVIEKISN